MSAEPGRTGGYVLDKSVTLPPLNFTATDLHKTLSPLYNPKLNDDAKQSIQERFLQRLELGFGFQR